MKAVLPVKILILVLIAVLVAACGPAPASMGTPRPVIDREGEEYAVYAAVIRDLFLRDQIALVVVNDHTNNEAVYQDLVQLIKKNLGADQATIDNLLASNTQAVALENSFNLDRDVVLIEKSEVDEIFEDMQGWDKFYQTYPASQGLMTLSKVGFNDSYDQALVYVGNQEHWRGGQGQVVLLEKVNGQWTVKKHTVTWIS